VFDRDKELWRLRTAFGREQTAPVISGSIEYSEAKLSGQGDNLQDVGIACGSSVYGLMLRPKIVPAEEAWLTGTALQKYLAALALVEPGKECRDIKGERTPTDSALGLPVVSGSNNEIGITEPSVKLLIRHSAINPAGDRLGVESRHLIGQIDRHGLGLVPADVLDRQGVAGAVLDRVLVVVDQAELTNRMIGELLGDLRADCAHTDENDQLASEPRAIKPTLETRKLVRWYRH